MTTQTRSPSKLILGAALAGATLLTAGCAGGDGGPRDTAYVARDVETLYFEAKRRLDNGQGGTRDLSAPPRLPRGACMVRFCRTR